MFQVRRLRNLSLEALELMGEEGLAFTHRFPSGQDTDGSSSTSWDSSSGW